MIKTPVFIVLLLLSFSIFAGGKWVVVNGQKLNARQIAQMERNLGTSIAPGNYLYNALNGCWMNLTNRTSGCLTRGAQNRGNAYSNRSGSGQRYSNGSWIHRSDAAGYSVGGTGDGCIYTPDWSNC